MKKSLLSLGCALVLLAANNVNAQDEMSFGLKVGGTFFAPIVDKVEINGVDYEGKWDMFVGGGAFFEYRLLEDMMSVGLEVGYAKRSIKLDVKKEDDKDKDSSTKTKDNSDYSLDIHALDITLPISFLPMEREGGLSIFVGPKMYIPLAKKRKKPGEDKSEDFKDEHKLLRDFNIGLTGGVKYEVEESGFFVGASYEYFFLDVYNDNDKVKAMKKALGKKEDDKFCPNGLQAFVGFDFARLLE